MNGWSSTIRAVVVTVIAFPALTVWADAVNLSPADSAISVSTTPTLELVCAPVGLLGGQFQVADDGAFTSIIYDSGVVSNDVCAHVVLTPLVGLQAYYWRARVEDDTTGWSAWSAATMFTTIDHLSVVTVMMRSDENGYSGAIDSDIRGNANDPTGRGIREWDQGSQDVLRTGRRPPGNPTDEIYRGLLRFELPQCLDSSQVINAWLELTAGEHGRSDGLFEQLNDFYRLRVAWTEGDEAMGTVLDAGDASWSYRSFPQMWSVSGAAGSGSDRDAQPMVQAVLTNDLGHPVWLSSTAFVDTVKDWLDDPSSNYGLTFQANDESFRKVLNMASREFAVANYRPRLVIQLSGIASDGTACDDGDACTDSDVCAAGVCGGTVIDCDNGLFCDGIESCDAVSGCQSGAAECPGQVCDEDGDACVECLLDQDCDDGSHCNGAEPCVDHSCTAAADIVCDDGVICTVDECDEALDACTFTPDDSACDNGTFCDGAEMCDVVEGCLVGDDPCPGGFCDELNDVCIECFQDLDCVDALYCNGDEQCVDGVCQVGPAVNCDDGVVCTVDTCDEQTDACANVADDTTCDDGAFCNGPETCDSLSGCVVGSAPCGGGLCSETLDACVDCFADVDCDNGLFCDGAESCSPQGLCAAGGLPCVAELCDEGSDTCAACGIDGDCDDGLACNGVETCVAGDCVAGTPIDCGDGIDCTVDTCNEPDGSCANTPDHAECSDALFCNGSEICDAVDGCVAGFDPCPDTMCDEQVDGCVECLEDADCVDAVYCNGDETCANGACAAGPDPCPGQVCNEVAQACDECSADEDCDDGLFCNGSEACIEGVCTAGTPACSPGLICNEAGQSCSTPPSPPPPPPPPPPADADNDGVPDASDDCPGTPDDNSADSTGCGESQRDSDEDGVNDDDDNCPDSPAEAVVDAEGCEIIEIADVDTDEDDDGIGDADDDCPMSPEGADVDPSGCATSQRDSDGDGVSDAEDDCEDTLADAQVDDTGCVIEPVGDSDGDSVANEVDLCPRSPSGARVDHRGCAVIPEGMPESPQPEPQEDEGLCGVGLAGLPTLLSMSLGLTLFRTRRRAPRRA